MLAPIVLFVYNRPRHTQQALEALAKNQLASESVLYIFADGPKENATKETLEKINETKSIIKDQQWCKEVIIREREKNAGLADSIIEGVTEIVNKYGKIIVLEDDIVTSKGFLKYMNDALKMYENEERVMHISGYMFPVKGKLPKTFFYKQTSCWGWATWADKWNYLETSADKLLTELNESGKINRADIDGTNQFLNQLTSNIEGKIKTWAVLWHFSVFLKDGLSLHPYRSLVNNIGNDGSGINCSANDFFLVRPIESIQIKKEQVKENKKVYSYLKKFYNPSAKDSNSLLLKTKKRLSSFIPSKYKSKLKRRINKEFRLYELEKERLANWPRFTETNVSFLGRQLKIVDIASYLFIKKELFVSEIYKFNCESPKPYIIDCGANIGLSIIYFKLLFPNSEILGFEPDDRIFSVLKHNIEIFNLTNVKLIKKACWNEETILNFFSEGADGGRVATELDKKDIIEVKTSRLRNYLNRKVDLLKIDIEGAESVILPDIKDQLKYVERIFIEFHSFFGKEQTLPELLSILKNEGFRIHLTAPGLVSQSPFISVGVPGNMDNQINIFGIRE